MYSPYCSAGEEAGLASEKDSGNSMCTRADYLSVQTMEFPFVFHSGIYVTAQDMSPQLLQALQELPKEQLVDNS